MQQREHQRQDCLVPARFTCPDQRITCYARIVNYCKGGACIKTRTPLRPGTTVRLALEGYTPDAADLHAYAQRPATVCWTTEERERGLSVYQAGIRYCDE